LSLKNDIEMVKEELNAEEQFFEKAVVTERFFKKYKKIIVGGVVVIALGVAVSVGLELKKQHTLEASNDLLLQLEKNPKDTKLYEQLHAINPSLAALWEYSQATVNGDIKALEKLKDVKEPILNDLISYEVAQDMQSVEKLDAYALRQNAIYRDLALIQSAVILIHEKKLDLAHEKLASISQTSPLYKVASMLRHYGIK